MEGARAGGAEGEEEEEGWGGAAARARLEEAHFPGGRAGAEERREFRAFWARLRRFLGPPAGAGAGGAPPQQQQQAEYDPRWRISLRLPAGRGSGAGVPAGRRREFRGALLHFLDFQQKRGFSRLARLQRERAALPIARFRGALLEAVARSPVVLVAGDTGCGKSTQVPQFLLEAGHTRVACTQPRRIACVALAQRVALESLQQHGSQVSAGTRQPPHGPGCTGASPRTVAGSMVPLAWPEADLY